MIKVLYGKDKKDGIKVWTIEVKDASHDDAYLVINHGKEGGKQTEKSEYFGTDSGKQGRNAFEQAVSEAEGRIKKQVDKGYRESITELEVLPILPMLAGDYNKIGHRINYPCYVSDKLDGVRCMAEKKDGIVTLKSRTGQPYDVPHIVSQLSRIMFEDDIFDGELYLHGYALQDITSAVKRTDTQGEIDKARRKLEKACGGDKFEKAQLEYMEAVLIHELRPQLQFIIFDALEAVEDKSPFQERVSQLAGINIQIGNYSLSHIKTIVYSIVNDEGAMKRAHANAIARGYEGIMPRNLLGIYESGKRSADLQKYKTFLDSEFKIIDHELDSEGLIVFVCQNDVNNLFFSVILGTKQQKAIWALTPESEMGKMMTVKYQSRYKDTLLPQFPTGVAIRDYE